MKVPLLAIVFSIALSTHAHASDQEFKALIKERKFAEAEKLANERVAKDPKDDTAWWYLARFGAGDQAKRGALIPQLEKCVADLPMSAKCHHALGVVYGSAALSAGVVNGIKYAGRIKDMFLKAVELDPASFEARRDLNMFYLQAPGIAGGSVRKAKANADAHAKWHAQQSQILRAEILTYEKDFEMAERTLSTLQPASGDEQTIAAAQAAWNNLGFALIGDRKHAQAVALFERRVATNPDSVSAHLGLGRAHLESGAVDAAIAALEKALALDARAAAHYRLGIAYQAKGDKAKAVAALQKFITYGSGRALEDAKARLETLKKAA
jgi:tetratricopeptide (TPR) repeat protein